MDTQISSCDVAIIGLAGRFPGAADLEMFWKNLHDGVESVSFFSDEELVANGADPARLSAANCVKARAVLEGAEWFDAAFFGMPPREAELTDPQHRLFLECAFEALESAGYAGNTSRSVGVFAAAGLPSYLVNNLHAHIAKAAGTFTYRIGNRPDYLATRTSYKLNLSGPSFTVQTACSSSLVAVHLACQSLLTGECDLALAGGSSIHAPQKICSMYQEGGIISPDGHCRPFDALARGTVSGDGVGLVVLKRLQQALADRDCIHAVIKGSAINNDGASKIGYTAPSIDGQCRVIAQALAVAGVPADTVTAIEAHGTGTPLGDPIEIAALTQAFRASTARAGFCAIGSVKSNIGHLDAAAGIAGLLKMVLALEHRMVPATLHYRSPNPQINFSHSPFYVNSELQPWTGEHTPRRAGVSSFGIGGTNAHVVLEEAPPNRDECATPGPPQVIAISARTPAALEAATDRLARYLGERTNLLLDDVAFTLQTGRKTFEYRRMVAARDTADAARALRAKQSGRVFTGQAAERPPAVVFMFPGQGAQVVGMGERLYRTQRIFAATIDDCSAILERHLGVDLRHVLYGGSSDSGRSLDLSRTRHAQPALFVTAYALARLWMSWGVQPQALVGHSVGEFVAACVAEVMSLEDALALIAVRSTGIDALPAGAMLAVGASEEQARRWLQAGMSIAAVNAPDRCVLSGPRAAVDTLERELVLKRIKCQRLATSHAFHSEMVESVVTPFTEAVARVGLTRPRVPIVSTVTGAWITDGEATDPAYWGRHLRRTVRFSDAIGTLRRREPCVLLEVGPGQALGAFARQQGADPALVIPSLPVTAESSEDETHVVTALGRLWVTGVEIDWTAIHVDRPVGRVPLPTYPFERQRYWIDATPAVAPHVPTTDTSASLAEAASVSKDNSSRESAPPDAPPLRDSTTTDLDRIATTVHEIVRDTSGLSLDQAQFATTFAELGLDSLVLMQVAECIQRRFGVRLAFRQLLEDVSSPRALAAWLSADVSLATEGQTKKPIAAGLEDATAPTMASEGRPPGASAEEPVTFGPWRPVSEGADSTLSASQEAYLSSFIRRYESRTKTSKQYARVHRQCLADNRNSVGFRRRWKELVYPIVASRCQDSRLYDVDGNEYVDLVMGYGVNLFGHAPAFVTEAIQAQLARGFSIGVQSELAGRVAALISRLTGLPRVTFCNTGSEAVMAALRLARTVTARPRVAMFAGSYHGITDGVLVRRQRNGNGERLVPVAPGIPRHVVDDVLVLEYASAEALERIRAEGTTLAAVLVEPVQSRRLDLQPRQFLHELRTLTADQGIALIFDEMITGFRIHPGGAQAWFGVQADLATYGKVAGGGLPIGIVAGVSRYMDAIDGGAWDFGDASTPQANQTFFAGTFCKHPLALAASAAVLERLEAEGPALQRALSTQTAAFADKLNDWCAQEGMPIRVVHFGSAFRLTAPPGDRVATLLPYHLIARGVHTWEGRTGFLSSAHTEEDLQIVLDAIQGSLLDLRAAGFLPRSLDKARTSGDRLVAAGPSGARGRRVPITDVQRGLWLATRVGDEAAAAYHKCVAVRLTGALDVEALRHAISDVVARHEALRATFTPDGEAQIIHDVIDIGLPIVDFVGLDADTRDWHLQRWFESERDRPFDLERGPLVRFHLARLGEDQHVLVRTVHHLVFDGWSSAIVLKELATLYAAHRDHRAASLKQAEQFGDYVQVALGRPAREGSRSFWAEQFVDGAPVLNLPTDHPRPPRRTSRGGRERQSIQSPVIDALRVSSARTGVTLFTTLLAGFTLLLHRLAATPDIVVGIPVLGRAGRHLVGCCTDVLPIRSRLSKPVSVEEYVRGLGRTVGRAVEHQDYSFHRIVSDLRLRRDPGRPLLVAAGFNLERIDDIGALAGIEIEPITAFAPRLSTELELHATERATGLHVEGIYRAVLFERQTIRAWLDAYASMLGSLAAGGSWLVNAAEIVSTDPPADHIAPSEAGEADVTKTLVPAPTERSTDPVEKALRMLWVEALEQTDFGADANFFELGGDSLRAMKVIAQIREAFGVNLSLGDFLETGSVALLAARLRAEEDADRRIERIAHLVAEVHALPEAELAARLEHDGQREPIHHA